MASSTWAGGQTDEIRVDGMPKSLLTLNLLGERLMVTAARAVTIGGVQFPAHIPRLVIPGERMVLPSGVALKQVKRKDAPHRSFKGTACMLKEMVGDGFSVANTRAASLTCLTGADAGHSHAVALTETMIGRGEHCAVRIRDRSVSRRHARVVRQRSSDFLEALPGTNGLFLNGQPVTEATLLCPGDVIELGHSLLRYDGPEKALTADEAIEPTVLVSAEDAVEIVEVLADVDVEVAREVLPATRPTPSPRPVAADALLLLAGAALVLIGMVVTLTACA